MVSGFPTVKLYWALQPNSIPGLQCHGHAYQLHFLPTPGGVVTISFFRGARCYFTYFISSLASSAHEPYWVSAVSSAYIGLMSKRRPRDGKETAHGYLAQWRICCFLFFVLFMRQQEAWWLREIRVKFLGEDGFTYGKGQGSASSQTGSIEQAVTTTWSRGGISWLIGFDTIKWN